MKKKKSDGWINVRTKPPKIGKEVFVYYTSGTMGKDTLYPFGWLKSMAFGDVTHWRPLPKPPETKDGERHD